VSREEPIGFTLRAYVELERHSCFFPTASV
jgi:hypothetical protein